MTVKSDLLVLWRSAASPWLLLVWLLLLIGLPPSSQATAPPAVAAASSAFPLTQSDTRLQHILNRGVIKVGLYYQDKPPFVMTCDNDTLCGLDIDLARMIAKALGVRLQFTREARSYTALVEQLHKGQVDMVLCKLSRTLNRALKILYSRPYLILRQTLVLNKSFMARQRIAIDYPITTLQNFSFRVGVREKTSYVEYAQLLFPTATLIEAPWDQLVQQVSNGEIDALMRDEYTVRRLFAQSPDLAIDLSAYVLSDRKDPIAAGLPPHSYALKQWLDLFFEERMPVKKTARDLVTNYPELLESP